MGDLRVDRDPLHQGHAISVPNPPARGATEVGRLLHRRQRSCPFDVARTAEAPRSSPARKTRGCHIDHPRIGRWGRCPRRVWSVRSLGGSSPEVTERAPQVAVGISDDELTIARLGRSCGSPAAAGLGNVYPVPTLLHRHDDLAAPLEGSTVHRIDLAISATSISGTSIAALYRQLPKRIRVLGQARWLVNSVAADGPFGQSWRCDAPADARGRGRGRSRRCTGQVPGGLAVSWADRSAT